MTKQERVDPMGRVTLNLPFEAMSARQARRLLTDYLVRAGVRAGLIQDAALVVSELVTNSVDHGRPHEGDGIEVSWDLSPDRLLLSVHDAGTGSIPVAGQVEPHAPRGRGLAIVTALSAHWWVDQVDGTRVTAELATA
jgi:anti-sigma regulatory factor (Ser/Thr protein kinase)